MARRKKKFAYITHNPTRKSTFRKRKIGLLKKASELSTLCGIEACVIISSPYDAQPVVWPSLEEAQSLLSRFKKMPMNDQTRKMENQESLLGQRISKVNKKLRRQLRDNREKEMKQVMHQCIAGAGFENLNMRDLNDLQLLLDQNLQDIEKRIDTLTKATHSQVSAGTSSSTMATPGEMLKNREKVQVESPDPEASLEIEEWKQWIKDLMNPPEDVKLSSVISFGDNNPTSSWSNASIP